MCRYKKVILFLDFDGVTHPAHESTLFFNANCMFWLEKIIQNHELLQVVISSSWREQYSIDELKTMLGTIVGERVIGMTPVIDDPLLKGVRFYEVITYLIQTNNINTKWLAIDDVKGFYMGSEDKVIWTNPRIGLSQKEYEEINFLLLGKDVPTNVSKTRKIINHLLELPKGELFTNEPFLIFGSHSLINQVFSKMHHIGLIKRIARGVYIRQ